MLRDFDEDQIKQLRHLVDYSNEIDFMWEGNRYLIHEAKVLLRYYDQYPQMLGVLGIASAN